MPISMKKVLNLVATHGSLGYPVRGLIEYPAREFDGICHAD